MSSFGVISDCLVIPQAQQPPFLYSLSLLMSKCQWSQKIDILMPEPLQLSVVGIVLKKEFWYCSSETSLQMGSRFHHRWCCSCHPRMTLSVGLSVCLSVCLSVFLSVCLSVCIPVFLFVFLKETEVLRHLINCYGLTYALSFLRKFERTASKV